MLARFLSLFRSSPSTEIQTSNISELENELKQLDTIIADAFERGEPATIAFSRQVAIMTKISEIKAEQTRQSSSAAAPAA